MGSVGGAALYGGTKAFLDRICTGAALELYPDNIAVNNLATTGAVVTPQLSLSMGTLSGESEPMEAFVEAALASGNRRAGGRSPAVSCTACRFSTSCNGRSTRSTAPSSSRAGNPIATTRGSSMEHYLKPSGH